MLRQHLVDEGLVTDLSSFRLFTEALQDVRIHTNRDQLSGGGPYGRPPHSTHGPKLLV
jgi:hypothetical protein